MLAIMNRLTADCRAQILHLLCEGMSIRAVTRLTGASKTTVTKLVVDAGTAAAWYQDRVFRNLESKRVQVDEIWGFVGAKAKNAKPEKKARGEAGDIWLWVATDADTKLVPSWLVGGRDRVVTRETAQQLMNRIGPMLETISGVVDWRAISVSRDCAAKNGTDDPLVVRLPKAWREADRRAELSKAQDLRGSGTDDIFAQYGVEDFDRQTAVKMGLGLFRKRQSPPDSNQP